MSLTDRQRSIARSLREWIAEHGTAPSVRELAAEVGLAPSTAAYHLRRLREEGVPVETRGRPAGRCPYCGR